MMSPRKSSKAGEINDSPSHGLCCLSLKSPVKRNPEKESPSSFGRAMCRRTPRQSPKSQLSSPRVSGLHEYLISSSPSPRTKERKVTPQMKTHPRIPRNTAATLFSPPYVPTTRHKAPSPHPPTTNHTASIEATTPGTSTSPTTSTTMSPIQLSLHENIARYGSEPQQFDDYDETHFDPYQFIANLDMTSPSFFKRGAQNTCIPPKMPNAPQVTLVLDLDETLVHCSISAAEISFPDFTFDVTFNNVSYTVSAKKRPGVDEFLEHIKGKFEIVVFTASQRVYAERLLDILDPSRHLLTHRLFREHCIDTEGNLVKDLTVLGRDLAKVVILDNSPQAFSFQVDNGIPILSWHDSLEDRELFKVCPLLDSLINTADVRPVLREKFELYKIIDQKKVVCTLDGYKW